MALKGLVIRQPWINLILQGRKTWEMRSQPCHHRGPVALIEKGTGTVVGLAKLIEALPAQSSDQLLANQSQHRIPPGEIAQVIEKGWIHPWVLTDVQRLETPVAYKHTSGGSWVNLSSKEERDVLSMARATLPDRTVASSAPCRAPNARPVTKEEIQLAEHLAEIRTGGSITVSPVRQSGNNFYIGVEWDEPGSSRREDSLSFEAIQTTIRILIFLISMVWLTCSALAFLIGMVSDSYSAVRAFLWALPACCLLGLSEGILGNDRK